MKLNSYKNIIIVGMSNFGARLASILSDQRYPVTVIDKDKDSFCKLSDTFSGYELHGDGSDVEILKRAAIETASIVIVATDNDSINILIGQLAKRIYKVNKVFIRLTNFNNAKLVKDYNIEVICPCLLSLQEFFKLSDLKKGADIL